MRSMIDSCFMCSTENKCNIVDNKIVTQIEYLMPEITIIKLRLPLRFCSICEKNLELFSTFKKDCVENSLRLETWIKEAHDKDTNIDKIDEIYIKQEVLDDSDSIEVNYSLVDEISIKEDPLQENSSDREFGDELQDALKEDSPPKTDTHFHEGSKFDINDESDQNSDDPDDVVPDNGINSDKNILVTYRAGLNIYICLICKKGFKNLSYLKMNHMKIHLGKRDFRCNECKKWFSHKSTLSAHMKQHTGIKDFQCSECEKWFSKKSDLTRHTKLHTGVKEFQCNECKKCFSEKSKLTRHLKLHAGVKEYQCNECKKWFTRNTDLTRHLMKVHTGVKDFQCGECKKWFSQKSQLSIHMKRHT